ncbi:MAG: hypothetical protein QOD77_382 [Thermoplasmata archaeon]|jgi:hypothetical protein|nr:hypothetical protein [Thermoplasmata archaeon]
MDRSLCVLAACLAVAAAFAGCTASGAPFDPIPNAGWKPGYSFDYTVELTGSGSARIEVDGEVQHQEEPFKGMPVGQRPMTAYRVLDATTVDGIPVYLALDNHRNVRAFRQADLQPLAAAVYSAGTEVSTVSVQASHDDHSWLRFPLERGDTWRGELRDFDSPIGFDMGVTVESTVYGMESVEGPNGPVDAVRIEHDFAFDEDKIKDMMLASADKEGIEVRSLSVDISASRTVYYAPSLHNIVRDDTEVSQSLFARFTQEGKDIKADMEADMTATVRLTRATLEEKAATPLDKLETVKTPRTPQVVTSEGQPAVSLDVKASEAWVNAAEAPTVRITADAVGVSSVVLRLIDSTGNIVQQDAGTSTEWTLDQPGRYLVEATARAADGYEVQAETEVVAGYELTVSAGCATVSTYFLGCDQLLLPVRPGILSLEVSAVRQPLAVEEGVGNLYVSGPQNTVDAPMQGNEATIRIDAFEEEMFFSDWQAWYAPTAGVMEDVDYHVVLDYGQPDQGIPADAASLLLGKSAETLASPWSRPLLPG